MEFTFDTILKNRKILYKFLKETPLDVLNKIPEGFNNSLFWNIAHVAITQELLVYNLSGLPMNVSDEMVAKYRKGTKPEVPATEAELEDVKKLIFSTFERMKQDYENGVFKAYSPYTTSTGTTLNNVEEAINFNLFHEGIHLGYILALFRAL
jgi:hypothetical protein